MRKEERIIDREALLEIIYLIHSGKNYAQIISKTRKTKPSPTVKQLKELEKNKYINSKVEKQFNKRIYFLTNKGKKLFEYYKKIRKLREEILDE